MNKRNLLYFLFASFIVAIFLWWWILLFQKNERVFHEKLALYDLIIDIDDSETTMELYRQEVDHLQASHRRQKMMIAGEGFTFLLLLLFGIIRLHRYFQREIGLARQQRNFLLSITHELRSPLASALLNIQTMLKRPTLDDPHRATLLEGSRSELTRLEGLVDKLLFTAQMEGGEVVLDMQEVDISELFGELWDTYRLRYGQEFRMEAALSEGIRILADPVLVGSIFTNLMDNAVKYGSRGGRIEARLTAAEGRAWLAVFNEGDRIDEREQQLIWRKFYRIGDEQTRSATGTGLGLYIVKRLSEMHRAKASVQDRQEGGVEFCVDFPMLSSVSGV